MTDMMIQSGSPDAIGNVSIVRCGPGTVHITSPDGIAFFDNQGDETSPAPQQTVTGAKGANAALASLLAALVAYGLIVDGTGA